MTITHLELGKEIGAFGPWMEWKDEITEFPWFVLRESVYLHACILNGGCSLLNLISICCLAALHTCINTLHAHMSRMSSNS